MKVPKRKKRVLTITLTSMIDMFTILIIYLLSQSSAKVVTNLSTIKTELPAEAADEETQQKTKKDPPLNLSIFITKEGFLVSAENRIEPVAGKGVKSGETSFAVPLLGTEKAYDFEGLSASLQGIKSRYPLEKQLIITADGDVPYSTLIATMDASREYDETVNGQKQHKELFPNPTIAAGVL
jgi:biopolymer transport protein ExbD